MKCKSIKGLADDQSTILFALIFQSTYVYQRGAKALMIKTMLQKREKSQKSLYFLFKLHKAP